MVKGGEKLTSSEVMAFLSDSCDQLGAMTAGEKKLSGICFILVAAFMVQPWTGIDPVYVFCVLSLVLLSLAAAAFAASACILPAKAQNANSQRPDPTAEVREVLDRVFNYIDGCTPAG